MRSYTEVVGRLGEGQPGWTGRPVNEYADVVECLWVFRHVGFFYFACGDTGRSQAPGRHRMEKPNLTMAQQVAEAAAAFEKQRTGHVPRR